MSKETQWTKGPWVVDDDMQWVITADEQRGFVCNVFDGTRASTTIASIAQANARLIAAAPELFEALDAVRQSGENNARNRESKYDDVVIASSAWDAVLAALAKALGSTP